MTATDTYYSRRRRALMHMMITMSHLLAALAALALAPATASAGTAGPSSTGCALVGDLQQGASTRGASLTPEGLGGDASETAEGCAAACCAHSSCIGFTQSSFQVTASKACAHGEACCWLKGGTFVSATGNINETSGQIKRPPSLVSPASVPIRVLTEVTMVHAGAGALANVSVGEHAVCTLSSTVGGWTRETETFAGGVVLNATAVRCRVNASADLGGLASLRAVTTSGGSVTAQLRLHAQLSVSIGRQPYTDEKTGQLLVRLSADAFPAAKELTPMASLLLGGRKHSQLLLTGPALQRGRTNVLSFALESLPAPIFVGSNATVTFELRGVAAATASALPFVRLGQARASQSVLDYATGAVLTGPERVPLLPNGFDSHFSSLSGAPFDERLAFSLARRGHNTVIFGACLDGLFTPACTVTTLAQLDALGRYGMFGLIGANWDTGPLSSQSVGEGKDGAATRSGGGGGPEMNGLSAFINNVRSHPALLGYYLFDVSDCTGRSKRPLPSILLGMVSIQLVSHSPRSVAAAAAAAAAAAVGWSAARTAAARAPPPPAACTTA